MDTKLFYAKSAHPNGCMPTVTEHLDAVAQCAAENGRDADMEAQARLAGLMHDFGKYSKRFQQVISGERQHVDHASGGAAALMQLWKKPAGGARRAVIEVVNAHHGRLKSGSELYGALTNTLSGVPLVTVNSGKEPSLQGKADFQLAMNTFRTAHPEEGFSLSEWKLPQNAGNLETMLYTRMLLSCLVDADYSVSAWEKDHDYFQIYGNRELDALSCLNNLNAYRDHLRSTSGSDPQLNRVRDLVYDRCGAAGDTSTGGLFTLTAPTGTGKTLALLHFALRHTIAAKKRRIIIVLPFLTLAEQNAEIYQKIIPSVLIDHSQNRLSDGMWEFTSKWNVPFIITTSVKFFEALFSDSPSDCRKLHSLAKSVVIFDEAQTLPSHLTTATLQAVNELCHRYHMTMVFSTATQPKFDKLPNLSWTPTEILPDHSTLYEQLKRTEVTWQLEHSVPLEAVAEEMMTQQNTCAIVNLRRHARTVYERLRNISPEDAFLISTDLCPAHRTQVIHTIRTRQKDGKPCRVAATQCIEAGVDLDFSAMYRALAPLEAIIQAAGRCNRNGSSGKGTVTVFEPEDVTLYPDKDYGNAAACVKSLVCSGGVDIHSVDDISRYYSFCFSELQDHPNLMKAIQERDFTETGRHYQLISEQGEKLIVPYSGMRQEYDALRTQLLHHGITPSLIKQTAPLTVTVFKSPDVLEQVAEPILIWDRSAKKMIPSGYWMLSKQYEGCYCQHSGLQLPETNDSDFLY